MRLHRFFVEGKLGAGQEFVLTNETQTHQIMKVFRLGKGDKVILFDGGGFDFVSEIKSVSKNEIIFMPEERNQAVMPKRAVNLFLATIRKERFEWAVEKATELGVASITPIITERSEHIHLNIERLKKIAVEASEQCGRGNVPRINEAINLQDMNFEGEILVADFGGENLKSFKLTANSYQLFVGPEGGWIDSEREFFKNHNSKFISLGETTLRAETAAIVAVYSI